MASVKNPYSFLRSLEGTYIFYDNEKPVVEGIVDPTITLTTTTDPTTQQTTYTFEYFDQKLFDYMQQQTAKYSTRSRRARVANNQPSTRNVGIVQTNSKEANEFRANYNAQKASEKATAQSTSSSDGFLKTVREGYGTTPNKNKVNSLTNNTGAYGGGISSLVYPADLITNQYGYNGCYTVFFISEHPGSTIAQKKTLNAGERLIQAEGGQIAEIAGNTDQKTLNTFMTTVASAGIGISVAKFTAGSINYVSKLNSGSDIKGAAASLGGSVASLMAGGAAAFATKEALASYGDKISVLQNNTQYQQLNVAIALPTPRIEDKHTLKGDGSKGAAIGGGLLQLVQSTNGIDYDKLLSTDMFGEIAKLGNLQNNRGEKMGDAVLNTAGHAADALLMSMASNKSEFGTTIAALAGKKVNPRKEQLFDEVEFRTFTMQFDLAARSAKDMENIESIIRIFKYHAYPELTPGNFMWIYPAHFDIVHYYRDQVNYHMPRHTTSVLTNIDVDYAGGQSFISVHHDGSPVLIKLTLTFTEIAILDRESIAKGY